MTIYCLHMLAVALAGDAPAPAHGRTAPPAAIDRLDFDRTISRPVLEGYLARSITMLDLLTRKGNVDDNIRMLRDTGTRFAGRTIYLWGGERRLPEKLRIGEKIAGRIHSVCPDMILQAAIWRESTQPGHRDEHEDH